MSAPAASKRVPSLRRHKASGRGFLELNGRRIYLGPYGEPATQERYHALLAEWLACGRQLPVAPTELTIVELIDRFWEFAESYYRKPSGEPTSSLDNYRRALRPLKRLYASSRAIEFGPRALKAVRNEMVEAGWCRCTVNQAVSLIRAVFKWATAEETIPVEVHAALVTLAPLRKGRSEAKDHDPIRPAPEADIEAIRSHVSRLPSERRAPATPTRCSRDRDQAVDAASARLAEAGI